MSKVYLSRSEVAQRIGVQTATLSRYKLPQPDVIVGSGARPTFGWLPETIDAWNTVTFAWVGRVFASVTGRDFTTRGGCWDYFI